MTCICKISYDMYCFSSNFIDRGMAGIEGLMPYSRWKFSNCALSCLIKIRIHYYVLDKFK